MGAPRYGTQEGLLELVTCLYAPIAKEETYDSSVKLIARGDCSNDGQATAWALGEIQDFKPNRLAHSVPSSAGATEPLSQAKPSPDAATTAVNENRKDGNGFIRKFDPN